MSLRYIRDYYLVPAKRGQKIIYNGNAIGPMQGEIRGATGQYLRVRFEGSNALVTLHPTWQVKYLEAGK